MQINWIHKIDILYYIFYVLDGHKTMQKLSEYIFLDAVWLTNDMIIMVLRHFYLSYFVYIWCSIVLLWRSAQAPDMYPTQKGVLVAELGIHSRTSPVCKCVQKQNHKNANI